MFKLSINSVVFILRYISNINCSINVIGRVGLPKPLEH